MPSTIPGERRLVVFPLPTLEEFSERFLQPLGDADESLELFAMEIQNVIGKVDTKHWEARLERPPTVADLGAFSIFLDDLDNDVAHLRELAENLRSAFSSLDELRREDVVCIHTGGDDA
jgi:hypothetical protein